MQKCKHNNVDGTNKKLKFVIAPETKMHVLNKIVAYNKTNNKIATSCPSAKTCRKVMTTLLFHCVHLGVSVFHSNGDPKHVLVSLKAKRD
jgi:hypothetical protein